MKDTQAIKQDEPVNSCELAMMLDKVTQMQARLQSAIYDGVFGNDTTQCKIANGLTFNLDANIIHNLDALRALVAEQEQADVNEEWEQERIRCGMRWGEEQEQASADISLADAQKIAQEIAGRARERREEFRASDLDTSPAFAVGDTVSGYLEGDLVERTISHFNTKYGMWVMTDGGWWEAKDLTLIRKANA